MAGAREGQLAGLASAAGLGDVTSGSLRLSVSFARFQDWWETYTFGIGPAGAYVAGLEEVRRERLRERCAANLPATPLAIGAAAWRVTGPVEARPAQPPGGSVTR